MEVLLLLFEGTESDTIDTRRPLKGPALGRRTTPWVID